MIDVRSLEEARVHIDSLAGRVDQLERLLSDHAQRFDTLQTPRWKQLLFRIDGWPGPRLVGRVDLNAAAPAWRPWRRWWRS